MKAANTLKNQWWKALTAAMFLYSLIGGLLIEIPDLDRLHQTLRNLFFHVPLWFAMIFVMLLSFIFSIRFLRSERQRDDRWAVEAVNVGLLFGVLGFATGSLWGNYAWGDISAWLINEPRSLAAIIAILFYVAYLILRGSLDDETKRARISAVYNIFAFVLYLLFIIVIPRMVQSLHPGVGGNPGFNVYDSDNTLKIVLYPAWVSFTLLALWLTEIRVRLRNIEDPIHQ
jgi:heme exporter protein C